MKKSLMLVTVALTLGLAACNNKPNPGPKPGPSVEVPTEDGKTTFFFSMAEASVEMPTYASIYMTGGAFGWKTGYDAKAFTKMEGSNVYYTQVANDAFDATASQGTEYQLVVGYNETASMPTDKSGLQWVDGRKSDECAAPGGLGNLTFEYEAGAKTVDLGTHTWSTALPKPSEPLKNYSFSVEFENAVPEYGVVMIFGSFNGWKTPGSPAEGATPEEIAKVEQENKEKCDAAKMTPNEDRTVWTIKFDEMIAGDYVCKILVEYAADVEANHNVTWNAIEETPDNYAFTVTQADGDGYVLDILGDKAHYSLPDPNAKLETVTFVIENSAAEGELAALWIAGVLNGWTITAMEAKDGKFYATYTEVTAGKKEFKILTAGDSWNNAICAAGNSNLSATLEVGTHVSATVTIKVDFTNEKIGAEEVDLEETAITVTYKDAE